ncbi:MAG: hypothetical protein WCH34_11505, partial [Bacteroidota bacterium]
MQIEIKELFGRRELKKYVDFLHDLYRGNPYWCPPLRSDELNTIDPKKNPAYEYCEARFWIAIKDGKVVGRIASIINSKANETWNEKNIRFGWFDFIDDPEVSALLMQQVQNWAAEKGLTAIHGPLGFTDMDNEGMLVKGFEEMSTLSAIYNHEYYMHHMERMGFVKDVDWVMNIIDVPTEVPEKLQKFADLIAQKYELRVFVADKPKQLLPYAMDMFRALNVAFKDLYGFVPLNEEQMKMYIKQYFGFIKTEYVCFVLDKNDKVVGFGINLPSLTRAMQKNDGKLFPFGFIHVLKAMKNNDTIDMYFIGIRPDFQNK